MFAAAVLPFVELLLWIIVIGAMIAAVGFVLWTAITAVLWIVAHRRGDDVPQPLAADGWFDALERDA
jgi:hypothetical protein